MENLFLLAIVGLFTVAEFVTIWMIGREREPIDHCSALTQLVIAIIIIAGCIYFILN